MYSTVCISETRGVETEGAMKFIEQEDTQGVIREIFIEES